MATIGSPLGAAGAGKRREMRIDLVGEPFVATDEHGVIRAVNAVAERLLEATSERLLGAPLVRFVEEDERITFRRELARIAARREGIVLRHGLRTRQGEFLTAELAACPAMSLDGELEIGWLLREVPPAGADLAGLARSAAELQRLERANERLEDEHRRLHRLLDRLPEGVIAVTPTLEVDRANAAARRFAHPAVLVRGKALPEPWVGFSLRLFVEELLERGAVPGQRIVSSGGSLYALSGSRVGSCALVAIHDVSRVERRDRAEREFVANAAHELRTPVASITASIEVLQSGAKEIPEDRDRFLGHIEREALRLTSLARSLLVLARVQAAIEEPRVDVVALGAVLEQAAARLVPREGVEMRVGCPPELVVLGNSDLVEQIVANLTENAAKNTYDGSISIGALDSGGGSVVIEISDTGRGMDAGERERAFERFYRGDGRGEGFGLGLTIAQQAAHALRGTLEVESAVGRGTTARLTLPSGRIVHP